MSVITVQNLKYRYPNTTQLAINDISFNIEKGEVVGIIGANGAGKSTLCQAIMGLVPQFYKGAYGGSVLIEDGYGNTVNAAKVPVCMNSSLVGLIFQNPFNQLSGAKDTVFDEVAFGLQNLGIPKDDMVARIEKVLKQLDIWEYRTHNPFELSGGQMQRVAIASILVMEPQIVILDEPTSQLDPQGTEEVFKAITQLSKMGITIIMVEQKLEKMAQYCNRIMLLSEGRMIDFDTPRKIFSRDDIYSYGIEPPVYTRISKHYNVADSDGMYPVILEDTLKLFKDRGIVLDNDTKEVIANINEENHTIFNVEKISFKYSQESKIFEDLSLMLDKRPTAIIGQNGAGKTTLVRLLKGLLKVEKGYIKLNGDDISQTTVASLASKVGYVFQNPDDQIFKSKVIDEVMFGPINIGMNIDEARSKALDAIDMMGLKGKEDCNPYDLELYERKMVAIASVVAMDTDVIILDEPTIAQDYNGKRMIANMIKNQAAKGKLVIAILHDMDFVVDNFERVLIMAHGRILADTEVNRAFDNEEILTKARLNKPYMLQLRDRL